MDITIRTNNKCIVNLPRCDYVFSSTRSCFVAYGFEESPLEKDIIIDILKSKNIEAVEAGGNLAPAQYAFCTKICSKIITSQFCAILMNNDIIDGSERPNANVNMEYGLMLGFNKFIIPFQKENQRLPFNVSGLDTVKYTSSNFKALAESAIQDAIDATTQKEDRTVVLGAQANKFLLHNNMLMAPINNDAERDIYALGEPCGFNLAIDFSGFNYTYIANFSTLQNEDIVWRVHKLREIILGRWGSLKRKLDSNIITPQQYQLGLSLVLDISIWIIVMNNHDKAVLESKLETEDKLLPAVIFSSDDIENV